MITIEARRFSELKTLQFSIKWVNDLSNGRAWEFLTFLQLGVATGYQICNDYYIHITLLYSVNGSFAYDASSQQGMGFGSSKKCWSFCNF